MKKIIVALIFLSAPFLVYAHGDTEAEIARGGILALELQSKETSCEKLSNEEFAALGEYYMEQMLADSHEAMNSMMETTIGEDGEKQMHAMLGRRLSNCEDAPSATSSAGFGFMPMMQMMMGFAPISTNNFQFPAQFNLITYLLVWIVLILIIAALFKWLFRK